MFKRYGDNGFQRLLKHECNIAPSIIIVIKSKANPPSKYPIIVEIDWFTVLPRLPDSLPYFGVAPAGPFSGFELLPRPPDVPPCFGLAAGLSLSGSARLFPDCLVISFLLRLG